jgi:1,4-alpha-glucan branching enzyme
MPVTETIDVDVEEAVSLRLHSDPHLTPYGECIRRRLIKVIETETRITGGRKSVAEFASGHEYFGMHHQNGLWIFREWAPNASAMFLKGNFSKWQAQDRFSLSRISDDGVWEIELPGDLLQHEDEYRLEMHWPGGSGDRIPAWTRRVVQDPATSSFNAQIWHPDPPYQWKHSAPTSPNVPFFVYETHVGMGTEDEKTGTYDEFRETVLPRIRDAGYGAIQIMALAEHPYYASFGYQVSSFFACSSRYGTPEALKRLVDTAHGMGLLVLMDLVHSHAVKNEVEGISRFDGTPYQFFHEGERGNHPAWDSKCFDYSKPQVLHFLLSNCRYWMDEFRFDGFRFDGVTSMLYTHHGLGKVFIGYADYFDDSVDEDALTYMTLANRLIHSLNPNSVTIAEDVSGMPGLAVSDRQGGTGFDYRYAMGVPDYWIKLIKETPDDFWPIGHLWHELTNRRHDEKTISYAESHDQAMVGDQTLIFRLMGDRMYTHMSVFTEDLLVSRGIALHKMIRLATLATAGHGYLNFMGNEFGHPEWIDFPREGNQWSHKYARRQWHLIDDPDLRYRHLGAFDRDMIHIAKEKGFPIGDGVYLLHSDDEDKVLAFLRNEMVFVFNFNPRRSYSGYRIPVAPGSYRIILDTDSEEYGGFNRQDPSMIHETVTDRIHRHYLSFYLPSRTAIILEHENIPINLSIRQTNQEEVA